MSPNMPQGFRSEFSSVPIILILQSIVSNACSPLLLLHQPLHWSETGSVMTAEASPCEIF